MPLKTRAELCKTAKLWLILAVAVNQIFRNPANQVPAPDSFSKGQE
jgi:hypothetical protein